MMEDFEAVFSFHGEILDMYLEKGYYRMHQDVFTANFVNFNNDGYCRVFWLRTNLKDHPEVKNHAVFKKNKRFSVNISAAICSNEIEELYSFYRQSLDFEPTEEIQSYLFDYDISAFDNRMISIRDGEKLIAIGYFDQGKESIAGIMNFFHPDYRKFSLGKFLMLLKIDYAIAQGMKYYYSGYIALDYDKFDYKIFPSREQIEFYLPFEDLWTSFPVDGKEDLRRYDI